MENNAARIDLEVSPSISTTWGALKACSAFSLYEIHAISLVPSFPPFYSLSLSLAGELIGLAI